jgi:hypothetical protein
MDRPTGLFDEKAIPTFFITAVSFDSFKSLFAPIQASMTLIAQIPIAEYTKIFLI